MAQRVAKKTIGLMTCSSLGTLSPMIGLKVLAKALASPEGFLGGASNHSFDCSKQSFARVRAQHPALLAF